MIYGVMPKSKWHCECRVASGCTPASSVVIMNIIPAISQGKIIVLVLVWRGGCCTVESHLGSNIIGFLFGRCIDIYLVMLTSLCSNL